MELVTDHADIIDQVSVQEFATYSSQSIGRDVPFELEGICFIGSGGRFSLMSGKYFQTGGRISVKVSTLSTGDYMDDIQKIFGVSVTQLATLFGTTRKTLYSWRSGSVALRKKNSKKLFELLRISQAWEESGFPPFENSEEDAGSSMKVVFELLCADEIDFEKVIFAGSRVELLSVEKSLADPFS